jgi:hypothetical protein
VYEPIILGTLTAQTPVPVTILDESPFSKFSSELLMQEIEEFSPTFQNRKAKYFGD